MAKTGTARLEVNITPSPELEALVRRIIRDELRRLATELSIQAMRDKREYADEVPDLRKWKLDDAATFESIAKIIQASAKKSEMEATP